MQRLTATLAEVVFYGTTSHERFIPTEMTRYEFIDFFILLNFELHLHEIFEWL